MVNEFREWLMLALEAGIFYYVAREFHYDKDKDDKKQRRTKTTRKSTTTPGGDIITEEQIDTIESKGDPK